MATIKGKWVFNAAPTPKAMLQQKIIFTSYYDTFPEISCSVNDIFYYNREVYQKTNGWIEEAYRTVDFGSTEQEVSDNFYTWFTANATPIIETIPTTITYNGTELASLEAGQTATLACNGKKAKSDIVIAFGAAGTITYNGTETAVSAGQTATMACNGKKMKTDVVIAV